MEILGRINVTPLPRYPLLEVLSRDAFVPEMHPALGFLEARRFIAHTRECTCTRGRAMRAGFKVLRYPSRKSNYRVIADKSTIAHWTFRTRCNYA